MSEGETEKSIAQQQEELKAMYSAKDHGRGREIMKNTFDARRNTVVDNNECMEGPERLFCI